MFDFSDDITKITADCDSAISKLKKANQLRDFKKNPPITVTGELIEANFTTKEMLDWAKQSLVAYTKAREHLTKAIQEIEDHQKMFLAMLTANSDPTIFNHPNVKKPTDE